MTRVVLCTAFILVSVLVSNVNCQQDATSIMDRLKAIWRNFFDGIRGVWNDFKAEVKARTADMRDWSQEMWSKFKEEMNKWMNNRNDITESEKEDMNNFIERLRMKETENEARQSEKENEP